MFSGALLLDNFDQDGTPRTAESAAAPSNAVDDLLPLRFQLRGPHINEFYEGYMEGYEDAREMA
jgi:hypothetical protein